MKIKPRAQQSGFSLIEIMVGMVIGLLAIIVMMQVFAVSEQRKRTANAGSDAQNSAVIALDGIQRNIGQSGYGFALTRLLGCNLQLPFGAPLPLAPVIINPPTAVIPAGDANTDTLLISYGLGNDQPEGYNVLSQSGTTYTIVGTSMLRVGDRVIAAPSACGATTLVLGTVQSVNASVVQLSNFCGRERAVQSGGHAKLPCLCGAQREPGGLRLHGCRLRRRHGSDPCQPGHLATRRRKYRQPARPIRTGYLGDDGWHGGRLRPDDTDDGLSVGKDPGDPPGPGGTQCPVRKTDPATNQPVTLAAPLWSGSGTTPIGVPTNPDGTPDALWQQYRYRVFETVVPIRNVAWMGAISGC